MLHITFLSLYFELNIIIGFLSTLDVWAKLGEILTGVAAIVAVITFKYQTDRDKTISTVDQITFFRKEIIPAFSKFFFGVKDPNDPKFNLPRINDIESFTIPSILKKDPTSAKKQLDMISSYISNSQNEAIFLDLINMIEEFSLRIIYMNCVDHEALSSVKDGFVTIVEETVMGTLDQQVKSGKATFSGTRRLYFKWKDSVDRRNYEERVKTLNMETDSLIKKHK